MHILVFYQYFGTPNGSWSTRIYELTRRWVEAGNNVTVITSPYEKSDIRSNGFISRQNIDGINLIVINAADSNKLPVWKRIINASIFSSISIYFALTQKYDLAIASSGPITVGIPVLIANFFIKKKYIFEVRDLWPQGAIELEQITNKKFQKLGLWFEKKCYINSSLVVSCSTGMKESIQHRFPYINQLVIPNGSDTDLFYLKEIPFKQTGPYFLYAGSLGIMDDCLQIIEAFTYLKHTNIKLYIAGDGVERQSLLDFKERNNLLNVSYLGLLPKSELVKWFVNAKGSIVTFRNLPVLQTCSPNKFFDSLAAGVPVIQTTTGWIKDLIDIENCGLNVAPNSPDKLAKAILMLAENNEIREIKAGNALRLGKTIFNRDYLAQKYLDALFEIDKINNLK